MQYTTRIGAKPEEAHVNYECPCGCTAGVIFLQESGTTELGQCCCGRLLWLGDDAEGMVRGAFTEQTSYTLDRGQVTLPWGEVVEAVLAVPEDATRGQTAVVAGIAHDPVCHMDILPATAFGTSEYRGVTYYFCARGCKLDFDEDPEGVLQAEAEYDHSKPMEHMMSTATDPGKKPWWRFWG